MKVFELQELEAATDSFSPSRLIGKGSHGSVYRGVLKDGSHVAVKKPSLGLQKLRDNTKLANEARVLSSLHPNECLINLLGISHDTFGNKVIVTEYMSNGTLHDMLHFSTTPPTWPKRVELALRIAKGVRFLHESSPSIVHRDIKSANVLLDENWHAKIADFGLAVRLKSDDGEDELNLHLPAAGTIGYIDPSYTTPNKLSTKIDVFSYGVVLLELISGRKAIDMLKSPAAIVEWALPLIAKGRTMEVCDGRVHLPRYMGGTIKRLLGMAACCLSSKESVRPRMAEVVSSMENLIVRPSRHRLSIDYFRRVIFDMMRRRKLKIIGGMNCGKIAEEDRGSGVGSSNMSKGTLLVREILADITL